VQQVCCYCYVHCKVIARMEYDMAAVVIGTETADLALHQDPVISSDETTKVVIIPQ
jgi:hypothetical protein